MSGPINFQTTCWTQLLGLGGASKEQCRQLMETLIQSYWPPIQAYIRRRGRDPATADDLTQEFFAGLLERNALQNMQREGGTFRGYLLQAVRNFLISRHRHEKAGRRDPGSPILPLDQLTDPIEPATSHEEDDEKEFDRQWALQVIELTLSNLAQEYELAGKGESFAVFEHQFRHRLRTGKTPSRNELAEAFDLTPKKLDNTLYRAKLAFRNHLTQVVAQTVTSQDQIESEILGLRGFLG